MNPSPALDVSVTGAVLNLLTILKKRIGFNGGLYLA